MPLDIMPAPPALPGGSPPGLPADAPPGLPAEGVGTALFGLLLAQTVGQAVPKAAPAVVGRSAPTVAAASQASGALKSTTGLTVALVTTSQGEDKAKDQDKAKDKTPAEAQPAPSLPWMLSPPAPPPAAPNVSPPAAGEGKAGNAATNSGKVMDTVPAPGGELLSSPKNFASVPNAPVPTDSVLTPTENVLTLSEPHVPTPPAASGLPTVPVVTATPSRAVVATPEASVSPPVAPLATASAPRTSSPAPVALPSPVPISGPVAAPSPVPAPSAGQAAPQEQAAAAAAPPPLTAPPALQNGPRPADNQPSKNAVGKTTGSPARAVPASRATGNIPAGPQAVTAKAAPEKDAAKAAPAAADPVPTPTVPAPTQSRDVTPMPPAERTQMLRQVSNGVETLAAQPKSAGPQQVTLQLHPRDWGKLNVSVTMTPTVGADGKVSTQVIAHIVAEHPAVKAALETGRADLRHALRDAGLHLDRLTVTVQAPAAGSEANAGGRREQSRGGEGWGSGQPAPAGTGAQGGASAGGGSPSPFAAFADHQQGRRPTPPTEALMATATEPEINAVSAPAAPTVGRVDTRA